MHNCDSATQDCINTLGSFYCKCKPGLETYFKNDQHLICTGKTIYIIKINNHILNILNFFFRFK